MLTNLLSAQKPYTREQGTWLRQSSTELWETITLLHSDSHIDIIKVVVIKNRRNGSVL